MNARTPNSFRSSAFHLARTGYVRGVRTAALLGTHDGYIGRELHLLGAHRVELADWGPPGGERYDLVVADLSPEVLGGRPVERSIAQLHRLVGRNGRAAVVAGGMLERSHRERVVAALKRRFDQVWSRMEAVPGGGYRVYIGAHFPKPKA